MEVKFKSGSGTLNPSSNDLDLRSADSNKVGGHVPRVVRPVSAAVIFNKYKHIVPKFRPDGKQVNNPRRRRQTTDSNILAENVKMPPNWTPYGDSTEPMTQAKLKMQRKKADLPDPSFDLDGDGHVSAHDLFLAKRFDLDKDGKLNEQELTSAKEAINSGYKDKFMFGLERSGAI